LIAGNLETLALAAAPASASSAKVCAAGVSARLATFGLAQVSFRIIFLLTFCEREGCATIGTSDLNVWHFCLSLGKPLARNNWLSISSKGLALAFNLTLELTVIERR
jgi:hypothetical protein